MKKFFIMTLIIFLPFSFAWSSDDYVAGYSTYVKSAQWITRSGKISLSIEPTGYARKMSETEGRAAFKLITSKFMNDPRWHNYYGLRDQFICHLRSASNKDRWNLEPDRKNVGLQIVVEYKCNPPWK